MEFTLKKGETKTVEQYFKDEQTKLKVLPFVSNVKDLKMCLQKANGIFKSIPITEYSVSKEIPISSFGYVWFEYEAIDKDCILKLDIG
jgi:hypothetical protein